MYQVPNRFAEEPSKPLTDSRFEDAITDKAGKPVEGMFQTLACDLKHGSLGYSLFIKISLHVEM